MADFTYEQLHKMTVGELRDIAKEIEDERLQGHSQLHKEQLLPVLCAVLGVEAHAHHEVVGIDKAAVKQQIRALKAQRDALIAAKTREARSELRDVRRKIHRLNRRLRRAMV
jgi:DNA-binding IclR family transcriptional regulator